MPSTTINAGMFSPDVCCFTGLLSSPQNNRQTSSNCLLEHRRRITIHPLARLDYRLLPRYGKYVSTFVLDPDNVRVICWQLTVNADARRRGREDVFKNLPADLVENFP